MFNFDKEKGLSLSNEKGGGLNLKGLKSLKKGGGGLTLKKGVKFPMLNFKAKMDKGKGKGQNKNRFRVAMNKLRKMNLLENKNKKASKEEHEYFKC